MDIFGSVHHYVLYDVKITISKHLIISWSVRQFLECWSSLLECLLVLLFEFYRIQVIRLRPNVQYCTHMRHSDFPVTELLQSVSIMRTSLYISWFTFLDITITRSARTLMLLHFGPGDEKCRIYETEGKIYCPTGSLFST